MRTDKNSGPSRTVRLSISGKQTDPEGNTQENTALHHAICTADGGGWLFTYMENGIPARLYISRSLAWMERGDLHREGSSSRTEPAESLRGSGGTRMVFDPALSAARCMYETPFGRIPMLIRTEGIALLGGKKQAAPFRLTARIRYTLRMDPDYTLTCAVTIRAV